jgi:hypothetical protein
MTTPSENAPLFGSLAAVLRLLDRFAGQGLIIGGVAASLLGVPRATGDVDAMFLVSTEDVAEFLEAAAAEGLVPRRVDAEDFARLNRIVLLTHPATNVNVDIALGALPFEIEAVERGAVHQAGPLAVRLPTPEDLIIMKAVAHRPIDLFDIEGLVETNPDLDTERIRYWVQQFAEFFDRPELWQDIAHWFAAS